MTSDVAAVLAGIARALPAAHTHEIAAAVAGGRLTTYLQASGVPAVRVAGQTISQLLRNGADSQAVALALTTAVTAVGALRNEQTVNVVWTGPGSSESSVRFTTVVLPELISEATEHLLLVSYAAHPSPPLRAALDEAADRGVAITLALERPIDNPMFTGPPDPFPGLRARRLAWHRDQRPGGASLHAKILLVDRQVALIGSANLTGRAETDNLECGLIVRGGPRPGQIRDHIESLLRLGHLQQIRGWSG